MRCLMLPLLMGEKKKLSLHKVTRKKNLCGQIEVNEKSKSKHDFTCNKSEMSNYTQQRSAIIHKAAKLMKDLLGSVIQALLDDMCHSSGHASAQ